MFLECLKIKFPQNTLLSAPSIWITDSKGPSFAVLPQNCLDGPGLIFCKSFPLIFFKSNLKLTKTLTVLKKPVYL